MFQLDQLPNEMLGLIAKVDGQTATTLSEVSKRYYAIAGPNRRLVIYASKKALRKFLCFAIDRPYLWKLCLLVTIPGETNDGLDSDSNNESDSDISKDSDTEETKYWLAGDDSDNNSGEQDGSVDFDNDMENDIGTEDEEDEVGRVSVANTSAKSKIVQEELSVLQKAALSITDLDPIWHTKLGENNYSAYIVLLLHLATKLEMLDFGEDWFNTKNFYPVNNYITAAVTEYKNQKYPLPIGLSSLKEFLTDYSVTEDNIFFKDILWVFALPNIVKFSGHWTTVAPQWVVEEVDNMFEFNENIPNNNPKLSHIQLSAASSHRISNLKELHLTNCNISGKKLSRIFRYLKNIQVLHYHYQVTDPEMYFCGDAWKCALENIRDTLEVLDFHSIGDDKIIGSFKDYSRLHTVTILANHLIGFHPLHIVSPLADALPPTLEKLKLIFDKDWCEWPELLKNVVIEFLGRKNSDFSKLKKLKLFLTKGESNLLSDISLETAAAEAKIEYDMFIQNEVEEETEEETE